MRHRKSKYTLDRKAAARNSLIKNLAQSLVLHTKIKTTKTKAKAVRTLADDLIFWGKLNDLHGKRMLRRYLNENAMKRLITEVAPQLSDRSSGYTRLTDVGSRFGDGAQMAVLEYLVQPKIEKQDKAAKVVEKKSSKKKA
ncbi:MAG TPA: 50S ribosomal protein L17 [Patescibacteria group bacterium]|nr:50S ribosomal protein L17 [Patescibacteria group bacterium]